MASIFTLKYHIYALFFNFVCCSTVTLLVLSIKRDSKVIKLFAMFTGEIAVWAFFYWISLITEDAVVSEFFFRACMVPVVVIPASFFHFISELTRVRVSQKIHYVNYSLSLLLLFTIYTPLFAVSTTKPVFVFLHWPEPGPVFPIHLVHFVGIVIVAHIMMFKVIKRADSLVFKRQVLVVFWGTMVAFSAGITNYLTWYRISPPLPNLIVSFYTVAILYAVFKHQLMDIRIVLRRSLVYSLLIACITGVYLVMVLILERWTAGFVGYRSFFATVVVAALIAVCFNPLRNWLQTFVDRALFHATPAELAMQREQLLVEVRKSDQMKAVATLAAGLAHEIKNPLASIKTFTYYLEQHHADPAFREKFQKIVGGEVERINLIVQQLLDFAKPAPPKLRPLDVTRVIDDTLEFLNSELMAQRVTLERNYTAHSTILGDPQQLKQVFLNLILNSLQAMNGQGQLTVRTVIDRNALLVTVRDNGCGIAAKDLSRVFEPFFTTKSTGTGLGLAVVQGIIKEHGGHIEVTSESGQGTAVTLRLPVAV